MSLCALCRDIYRQGGSVESYLAHYNQDHYGQPLPSNYQFPVHQCIHCGLLTKSKRGLTRHVNAKHATPSTPTMSRRKSSREKGRARETIDLSNASVPTVPLIRDMLTNSTTRRRTDSSSSSLSGSSSSLSASSSSLTTNPSTHGPMQRKKARSSRSSRKNKNYRQIEMSRDISRRIQRAKTHRLYVLEMHPMPPDHVVFLVQGSTGNEYVVDICKNPSCSCPDHSTNGHICKHLLYVYLKVLRMEDTCSTIWQRRISRSELTNVMARIPTHLDPSVIQHNEIINLCTPPSSPKSGRVAPSPDSTDVCPICFDEFYLDPRAETHSCRKCGQFAHAKCMAVWSATCKKHRNPVTCTLCRAKWKPKIN